MKHTLTRRTIVAGMVGASAAAALPSVSLADVAHLTGIDWGGPLIAATKKIAAGDRDVDITWDLHTGGAATVIPKIQAAWPKPVYDVVACWNPVYVTMINEGWLEPITPADVPNIRDVPKEYLFADKSGAPVNVPRSLAGMFWGYRADTAPVKVAHIEQLFDPKLKGQICWPGPSINSNLQLLSLALSAGGNEKNMEPGWELLKKLARSGNIGRIANTETDFITSFTTGETTVAFWNMAPWKTVSKDVSVKVLTRVDGDKGMKAFLYQDGWVVLKNSPNKKAAMDFVNFFISPQNNQEFNQMLGQGVTNRKAKASGFAENITYTPDEIKKYAYFPDFVALAKMQNDSVKRFETEIVPLLK